MSEGWQREGSWDVPACARRAYSEGAAAEMAGKNLLRWIAGEEAKHDDEFWHWWKRGYEDSATRHQPD